MSTDTDPLAAWYREHEHAAAVEGWSLFETCDAAHDPIEVQGIDDMDFGDDQAFASVARADTPHARAAIRVLRLEGCRREIGYLRAARRDAKGDRS